MPRISEDIAMVFFNNVKHKHGRRVERHMLDILVASIENQDEVSLTLVELVLGHLVEPLRSELPAACSLARAFLQQLSLIHI